MFKVCFYAGKSLVSTKKFRSQTTAMWRARNWASMQGYRSTVSIQDCTFAYFNRPC